MSDGNFPANPTTPKLLRELACEMKKSTTIFFGHSAKGQLISE